MRSTVVLKVRLCNVNKHTLQHKSLRYYGMMELQDKFGRDFKKIQELDLENATPLEKKMHTFLTRIQKSTSLNDSVIIHNKYDQAKATEPLDMAKKSGGVSKPNMTKVIQSSYNWNPYHGRSTKKNDAMQHDHLDTIPNEYKQAGWGMQPQPITGSPQIHKQFPNTNILKNMMSDGQRVFEMGHLLTNPLVEMGFRDANIADGRDYNVLERTLQPFSSNVIEQWHGSQAINSQKETFDEFVEKHNNKEMHGLTQRQLIMRRLKERARIAYIENESLPPYKFGYEDIPVFVYQKNYHCPDKLGDPKRTRELKAVAEIYLKYIWPNMSDMTDKACRIIGGKYYHAKTTKMTFKCNNHYFYKDNEKQIIQWISKLIVEIDRLAEYLSIHTMDEFDNLTWEEYKHIYNKEWEEEKIYKKWNKVRWKEKMLALPQHMRSNYNLYSNGNRMNKLTKYLDLKYDKTFLDAGNILQTEGPKKHTASAYYNGYLPKCKEIMTGNIDELPEKPSKYAIDRWPTVPEDTEKRRFNIVHKDLYKKRAAFGQYSCYLIPPGDKQFEDINNAFHYPLVQPFTGLRLRKFKLTPWSNAQMFKCYRYERNRLGMKLVFGDEQFKRATIKKIEEKEAEKTKGKQKIAQTKLASGKRRDRKKFQAKQRYYEMKAIRRKKREQKEAAEPEDNPLFNYLGSKKIVKQFSSQIHDISG